MNAKAFLFAQSGLPKNLPALALFCSFLLMPTSAWSQASSATRALSEPERAALSPSRNMLVQGENVAATACADCHGINGISTADGIPNLAGQRTVYLHRVLQAYQSRERRNDAMNHATGFLNDEALLAVAAWYASLAPARPAPQDGEATRTTPAISLDPFTAIREPMKKCIKCHGEDGNSTASGMPSLSAQDPAYFVESMQAYLNGSRNHKLMKKFATGLDDASLERMGVFYAVQEPARTETSGDGDAVAGRAAAQDCASCHGEDGNASGADMPTLAGLDARYFGKAMQAYKTGKRKHQPMFEATEHLDETDIRNLATFYALQEPVRRNVRTPLTTAEWIERCERCHGIDGNSTDPRFPMLAGQNRDYLANALQAYVGSTRSNTTMHAMADPLSEADIELIVEHYATREPKSVVYMQLPCEDQADQ